MGSNGNFTTFRSILPSFCCYFNLTLPYSPNVFQCDHVGLTRNHHKTHLSKICDLLDILMGFYYAFPYSLHNVTMSDVHIKWQHFLKNELTVYKSNPCEQKADASHCSECTLTKYRDMIPAQSVIQSLRSGILIVFGGCSVSALSVF